MEAFLTQNTEKHALKKKNLSLGSVSDKSEEISNNKMMRWIRKFQVLGINEKS